MTDVFISYSRKDKVFVRRLFDALTQTGRDAWVDWESIPYSAEWWNEICDGIEKADNFLVIVSTNWLGSKICHQELEYARQYNKRIIPVIRREVDVKHEMAGIWYDTDWENLARQNWEYIEKLNWLFFRKRPDAECDCDFDESSQSLDTLCDGPECDLDNFSTAFESLLNTIKRDDAHVRRGKDLLTAAKLWEANQRNVSYLLRGEELSAAQSWLLQSEGKDPTPTALHHEFIEQSAKNEANIRVEEDRRLRQLRNFGQAVIGLGIAAVLILGIAIIAGVNAVNANSQVAAANATLTPIPVTLAYVATKIQAGNDYSESLRLANAAAALVQDSHADRLPAILLGIRALKVSYTAQADTALQQALASEYTRQVFKGHSGIVPSVTFSPDGKSLLTASGDNTARLWDVPTGKELRRFSGDMTSVESVAFSPDGMKVLTGSYDGAARVWDITTGKELHRFSANEKSINSAVFSPDGKMVLTGGADNTARLWDSETGVLLRSFTGEEFGFANSVAFSPDGKTILTAGITGRLWDVATGALLRVFDVGPGEMYSIVFSPDGKTVLTGTRDNIARLWDVATGVVLRSFTGGAKSATDLLVAFSPDGKTVLTRNSDTIGGDNIVRLWDAETGSLLRSFEGNIGIIYGVAFSPDGKSIATGTATGPVYLWDIATGAELRRFGEHTDRLTGVAFSPDGRTVMTNSDNTQLWDVATGKEVLRLTEPGFSGAFSPDGKTLVISVGENAQLWNVANGKALQQFTGHTEYLFQAVFSPDGKMVLTGGQDTTARVWDAATGAELRRFSSATGTIFSVAFSPDGRRVLSGEPKGIARLWDVATGAALGRFGNQNKGIITTAVWSVAFSPDGKTILLAGDDGAQLWDAATGKELRDISGDIKKVNSAVFSPDGKSVLVGTNDGTVRLWDVATGAGIRRFIGHTNAVYAVAFSPDGKMVLTGSGSVLASAGFVGSQKVDSTARLWLVDINEFIAQACSRVYRDFTPDERQQFGVNDQEPTCPQFAQNGPQSVTVTAPGIPISTPTIPVFTPIASATPGASPTPMASPSFAPTITPTITPTLVPVTVNWTPFSTQEVPVWTPFAWPTASNTATITPDPSATQ